MTEYSWNRDHLQLEEKLVIGIVEAIGFDDRRHSQQAVSIDQSRQGVGFDSQIVESLGTGTKPRLNENLLFGLGGSNEKESVECGYPDTQRFEVAQNLAVENQSLHPVTTGQVLAEEEILEVQIKTVL
jgi:hypothetical protein